MHEGRKAAVHKIMNLVVECLVLPRSKQPAVIHKRVMQGETTPEIKLLELAFLHGCLALVIFVYLRHEHRFVSHLERRAKTLCSEYLRPFIAIESMHMPLQRTMLNESTSHRTIWQLKIYLSC